MIESSYQKKQMPSMGSWMCPYSMRLFTQPDLAGSLAMEYQTMALSYDRILRNRQIPVNKSDTTWSWSFNTPCKSFKGILVLFEEEKLFARDMSSFYNPKIKSLSQLYSQEM